MANLTLNFYTDPGHGWLRAPLVLINKLGVTPSKYSYTDSEYGYLEEDMDASLFIEAAKKAGYTLTLKENHSSRNSFVRSKRRFSGV